MVSIAWILSKLRFPLSVELGGTGATSDATARTALSAAKSGANSDITSLSAMTTALSIAQGGTNAVTAAGARSNLGAAASNINSDITLLNNLSGLKVGGAASVISGVQGMHLLWNTGINGTSGAADFVCNQGGGGGGFTWRTVNNTNTVGGPSMVYSFDGTLQIPAGPVPQVDNGANCGRPALRWASVYAVNGAIQTSDAREKTAIAPMSDDEIKAGMALAKEIGSFKWLHSIAEKGEENSRNHIGMTVQRAIEIMESFGLIPFNYAFICYDEWPEEPEVVKEEIRGNIYSVGELMAENALYDDFIPYMNMPSFTWEETSRTLTITKEYKPAGNRYGFRYDQLALFIARGQEDRIKRLEEALNL